MTQANVKIVDTDGSDLGPIIGNSDDGGTEVLTIAATVAVGADQPCRSCVIWTDAADTTVKIDGGLTDADAGDFLMLASQYISMPVKNTNLLRFFGTNGAKIYILWRS
jgi:hypothetical protein